LKDWGFDSIWLVDFEFNGAPGDRQHPVCLVAVEFFSGQCIRLWLNPPDQPVTAPPYPIDDRALFVAYFASAELGCHLSLGWPLPANTLDLYTEFRQHTNGRQKSGRGLLDALAHFGLNGIGSLEKDEMRALVLRGGPWTEQERADILDYCEGDVRALQRLLPAMAPELDLPRALLRGRYMAAVARMEFAGVPIDMPRLELLREKWNGIKGALIEEIDQDYGVFEQPKPNKPPVFKQAKFKAYLERAGIPWPQTPCGRLATSDKVFREKAKAYPQVAPLRELLSSLADLRLSDLQVGADGRNRALLSPFGSRTGRNQPSNSKFIFGPSVWLRGLIKPAPGYGIAYIDYSQQEFGIAAVLSDDTDMATAYASSDPYLEFAKQSGAVPRGATKETHGPQRELHKQCVLGVQYGMEAHGLAERLGQPKLVAAALLDAHRQTYRKFWRWSDRVVNHATLEGRLWTVFGWQLFTAQDPNPRSWRNFPMQANGAEMLRLAICLMTEAGVEVCAPVHDAVLIGAPVSELDAQIAIARRCMAEASKVLLSGFEIRTEVKKVEHPARYSDPRGEVMWGRVMKLLGFGDGGTET
jgi:hypothetical protein